MVLIVSGCIKSVNPKEKVILYFHGGGYVSGAYQYHRTHVAKWVNTIGINALVFNYRLAPEHPYPAALNDSIKVYERLLEQGYEAHHIILAGDSAGAGLCLCTLNALKDKNIPMPLCAIAISPWTDLACKGDAYEKNRYTCLSPQDSWTVLVIIIGREQILRILGFHLCMATLKGYRLSM